MAKLPDRKPDFKFQLTYHIFCDGWIVTYKRQSAKHKDHFVIKCDLENRKEVVYAEEFCNLIGERKHMISILESDGVFPVIADHMRVKTAILNAIADASVTKKYNGKI